MQRRLAIALVATALVTVVLVGFGMLMIAQSGARSRAEDGVTRALNVLVPLIDSVERPLTQGDLAALENQRRDLQLDRLEPVLLADDGTIRRPVLRGRGNRAGTVADLPDLVLTGEQSTELLAGGTVVIAERGVVYGLRAPDPSVELPVAGRVALLASRPIVAIPRQTVVWFVLSSLVVLAGALAAGIALARRLVRPIREIEHVTGTLAAGDLTARVDVRGGDEVAQLGHSVNRMAADLERSRTLDQQFLMSVSHDLKTPLTAIAGYAEALRDGAVADSTDAGEIIGNHAARLDRLVGDLLDLAKLDANRFRLDLRPVDLVVVSGRTAAGLAPEAANHGVTIVTGPAEASPPIVVVADPDRLAQAIGNMVSNAITFADRRVSVEVSSGMDGRATVAVVDDGPGFAPDELPHVFDRLYTGRAGPRRAENPTGLGLAIVRELAAAMGGSVTATNDAGGGARISLSLPRREPGAAAPPGPGLSPAAGATPRPAGPPPDPTAPTP